MNLHGKTGLLIDDVPEMRSSMRLQLASAGLEKCDQARNVKEAIERLSAGRYDLVLCDYNLGQGADGQQLLELVRRRNLLPLDTAFLMITGETRYEQVSTAAEYSPDDYLIKPFTAEILVVRLSRILDKKTALRPITRHMGGAGKIRDTDKALAAAEALLAAGGRYTLDVLRLKGDLLAASGRHDEGLALYEGVLQQRATPWAEVGKARLLATLGHEEKAQDHLRRALAAYPNYLAAYDSLAQIVEKTDKQAAQEIVEQALKVAPSTQRQRRLGGLAFENKNYERAETAYRRAVEKDRTGFFKGHEDYVGLAKSCIEQGKTTEALNVVKDLGASFAHTPELKANQAAVECQVHARTGNTTAAMAALERALAQQVHGLAPAAALEVAQACFASGRDEEARQIILAIVEDHDENETVLIQARAVFAYAGRAVEGGELLADSRKRMIKLNNDAVGLANAGQIDQAIEMLTQASDRLSNNAQIALNAALALLMRVHRDGTGSDELARASRYITQARNINPDHAKLPGIVAFYQRFLGTGTPPPDEE